MELNLKEIVESVERQKQSTAKLMKISQIKDEIQKISNFDKAARQLGRKEE